MRFFLWMLAIALAGCEQSGSAVIAECIDPSCRGNLRALTAETCTPPEYYVPYIAGDFSRVYAPPGTRYLNDHTLVKGPDGTWHVYGITNDRFTVPEDEKQLLHATAPSLNGPWSDQADILTVTGAETVLWAPHAFERVPGMWTIYYWGGNPGIRRADSSDLLTWVRVASATIPGGRDPFVLHEGGRWLLYSVGVDSSKRGQVLVSESANIDSPSWSTPTPALTSPVPDVDLPGGDVESPFVVSYKGQYYLFITHATTAHSDYNRTLVFRSADPKSFSWSPIAVLRAHAPEIVEEAGQMFITSGGWPQEVGERSRGLSIAPLAWVAR